VQRAFLDRRRDLSFDQERQQGRDVEQVDLHTREAEHRTVRPRAHDLDEGERAEVDLDHRHDHLEDEERADQGDRDAEQERDRPEELEAPASHASAPGAAIPSLLWVPGKQLATVRREELRRPVADERDSQEDAKRGWPPFRTGAGVEGHTDPGDSSPNGGGGPPPRTGTLGVTPEPRASLGPREN